MGKPDSTQSLVEPEQAQALQKQPELQALQDLANMRQQIRKRLGPFNADLLAEARAEWERDVERIWADEEQVLL